jgi:hypothetical protein
MPHPNAAKMEERARLLVQNYGKMKNGEEPIVDMQVTEIPISNRAPLPASAEALNHRPARPIAEEVVDQQLGEELPNEQEVIEQAPNTVTALTPEIQAELDRLRNRETEFNRREEESRRQLQEAQTARQTAEDTARQLREQQELSAPIIITDEDVAKRCTPAEIEAFGIEQCKLILRAADEAARKNQIDSDRRRDELSQRTEQQRAAERETEAERLFFLHLESAVPDWDAINKSAGFMAWVKIKDPSATKNRQSILNARREVRDAPGVIELFKAYKATLPKRSNPNSGVQPSGRGPAHTPGNPPSNNTTSQQISRSQIAAWGHQRSKGQISREAWQKIEQRINHAAQNGLIVDG